jgi:osmotically-inducible protein OsmY
MQLRATHHGNDPMADDQILDEAHRALSSTGYGQLRNLHVYCDHGRVTLQGRVPSYYLKQVAQAAIQSLPAVCDIDNDLQVMSPR